MVDNSKIYDIGKNILDEFRKAYHLSNAYRKHAGMRGPHFVMIVSFDVFLAIDAVTFRKYLKNGTPSKIEHIMVHDNHIPHMELEGILEIKCCGDLKEGSIMLAEETNFFYENKSFRPFENQHAFSRHMACERYRNAMNRYENAKKVLMKIKSLRERHAELMQEADDLWDEIEALENENKNAEEIVSSGEPKLNNNESKSNDSGRKAGARKNQVHAFHGKNS